MKKNYIFYTLFFLFSLSVNSQVVLGEGDLLNSSVPIEAFYGYSYSQSIYKSNQINASGSITGVSYTATESTTLATSGQWVVYVGLTEKETFESTSDWIPISELIAFSKSCTKLLVNPAIPLLSYSLRSLLKSSSLILYRPWQPRE